MKIISWNVNGIRAAMKKGFMDFFNKADADIFCLQETKIHDDDLKDELKQIGAMHGYSSYWFGAKKKGYSGTAIISRENALSVQKGFGIKKFDDEGRTITFELEKFYVICVYAPNAKPELSRLDENVEFNNEFIKYCEKLRKKKPVIFCGDLNVAHEEIDLKNPKNNEHNAGFSIEEREAFQNQLEKGYLDTFRIFNKEPGYYTWWSYRFNARAKDIGWRIDYFIASKELKSKIFSSEILKNILGSDHCPIILEIIP
jgi:exodeoxyribonuclease-3